MSRVNQRGFTMIELVVVIVVLGILAAFAVPRFMGLDTQARIATVNSLAGSIRAASTMAHGIYLSRGNPTSVNIEGQTITFAAGYPDLASIGKLLAVGTVTTTGQSGTFAYNTGTGIFQLNGAPTPSTCGVQYAAATTATVTPTITFVPANLGQTNATTQVTGGC